MDIPKDKEETSKQSSQAIADDIAMAIAARKLPPGTKLREEALAGVYSVSRTKIRAALLILSKDKLVNIVPDKGAFVSQPSEKEAREVFAARRIIEAAMTREFIAKAKALDYKALERHLKQEHQAVSGGNSRIRSEILGDFHILIAKIVGNQVLTDIMQELIARSTLITMLYQSERDAACSSDEHLAFLRAAKSGDTEHAIRLMMEHLEHVESALQFNASEHEMKKDLITALLT